MTDHDVTDLCNNTGGFTLLELLFTLSLVAILTMMSVPSLHKNLAEHQLNAVFRTLRHQFYIARNYAISHRRAVLVCALNTQGQCDLGQDKPVLWHYGWRLCTPLEANFALEPDSALIAQCSPQNEGKTVHILSSHVLSSKVPVRIMANRRYVMFNALGTLAHFGGTFSFCSMQDASLSRTLILNGVGRPREGQGAACV